MILRYKTWKQRSKEKEEKDTNDLKLYGDWRKHYVYLPVFYNGKMFSFMYVERRLLKIRYNFEGTRILDWEYREIDGTTPGVRHE